MIGMSAPQADGGVADLAVCDAMLDDVRLAEAKHEPGAQENPLGSGRLRA